MSSYETHDAVAQAARNLIRDFPKFFEDTYAPLTAATIPLEVPMIASLEIRSILDNTEVTDFAIDYRNGVVKLASTTGIEDGIHVYGYHYEWFLDEDLTYFSDVVVHELIHDTDMSGLTDMTSSEQQLVPIGVVMYALYSLLTELSLDIDISTPEGMMIPAHMRFNQVMQLFQYWKDKYNEKAAALNLGMGKISIYNLRRISRMTGRYVPEFRGREIDDPRWPVRVFPEIPELIPDEDNNTNGSLVNEFGVGLDGWQSIGGSGS